MPKMTVGGRLLELDKETVERKMRDVLADTIQKHVVEIGGTVFPPKQVLAEVTGWERRSFTTAEAQRVLTKVGFICREAGVGADGRAAWVTVSGYTLPKLDDPEIVSFSAQDGWWAHFTVDEGEDAGTWTRPIIGWAVIAFNGFDGKRRTQIEPVVFDTDDGQAVIMDEYCRATPHPRFTIAREERHPEGQVTG
jgi:hypothetical protein